MSKRIKKIMQIFSAKLDDKKISYASEDISVFISREKFIENLKGVGKKNKAEIPTMLTE